MHNQGVALVEECKLREEDQEGDVFQLIEGRHNFLNVDF